MNKNIIQEIRELVSPTEREKARLEFEGYPNDEEIRKLRAIIESGIFCFVHDFAGTVHTNCAI